MLCPWRHVPDCFRSSHFFRRLLCMCDGIVYKMGLLVCVLLLHDFLQCAADMLNRRSEFTFVVHWLLWPACYWYQGDYCLPCRGTQIYMRVCQVRKVNGCGLSRFLLGFCLGTLWFLFLMTFIHALFVFVISWEDIRTFCHVLRFTSYHWLLQICNIEFDATSLFYAVPFSLTWAPGRALTCWANILKTCTVQ